MAEEKPVLPDLRQKFLDDIHKLILEEALDKRLRRSSKVINFLPPRQLKEELELDIATDGATDETLLAICKKVIEYSVPIGHPRNFNLLIAGVNTVSLAGSWLTDSLNANIHIYESAPAFIVIEKYIIDQLCQLIGFPSGDGVFVPGSSFGNMMGVHLARHKRCGDVNRTGLFGLPRFTIFCSSHAHYSVMKAAQFLGFGTDSLRYIEATDGKMRVELLEEKIMKSKELGEVPLIVIATCGTTVLGGFDDLVGISDVCKRHNLWMHADAAWGGGALFPHTARSQLLAGIELCDSVVWSLHKLIGAQVQCAAILTKHMGLLEECNSGKATYLFAKDKFYDTSYDVGDKTVQCGRKVDSLKLWLMWKSLGHQGMTKHVERALDNARYFTEKLKQRPGFRLVIPSFQFVNISFWYIPIRMREQKETEEWWKELGTIAPRMKQSMMLSGTTLISYQPIESDNLVNFFRIIVSNASATTDDLDFVLDELDRIGRDL